MGVIRDFDLNEWREMSSDMQEMAALAAGQSLRKLAVDYAHACDNLDRLEGEKEIAMRRADLHARRCELALAILRDDEAGLTQAKLQQIADVIWPQPIDETQKPTRSPSTEEKHLAQLLHIGVVSIREMLNLLPVGGVSVDIECTECGHIQSRDVGPTIELGGLKHQIESLLLRSKELLKLYGY